MRLSVLDQSPISEGSTGAQALAHTLDLARLADELGYHRYWVAEHHGGPMLACAAPEVLIGPIAAAFVVTLVKTMLILKGVDQNWAQVIQGTLIIVVVMIGGLAIRQRSRR